MLVQHSVGAQHSLTRWFRPKVQDRAEAEPPGTTTIYLSTHRKALWNARCGMRENAADTRCIWIACRLRATPPITGLMLVVPIRDDDAQARHGGDPMAIL
jgi:hypothetical protein